MYRLLMTFLLGLALVGCPPASNVPSDDDDDDDDATADDDVADDDDVSDDDVADDDDDDDACADYRTEYPGGPYGTSVGAVLADVPGMVDGQGNPHDFEEIYRDTSKVVLVIANAFDT